MSKKNQKYWRRRAIQQEKDWTNRCKQTIEKQLATHYQQALIAIKDDILKLYGSFANANGLNFDEARQLIGSKEFREWRMTMQEYLQRIAEGEKGFERELNTLAMRPRINRLEKLYAETLQELDKLGRNINDDIRNFLSDSYKSTYAKNIFDFVKVGGLSVALSKLDSIAVEKVIASRWSGKNFSQRIWTNTKLLSGVLRETISSGVHRGLSIPQMSKMVEDKMNGGYRNAVRLVRTEMNFVNNQAHADSMKDAGVEQYEFMAVMDGRTSQKCRERDGEHFLLEEKVVGENYPPLHPRCRSTVCPFIEGVSRKGTRTAKDSSGKNIEIPSAMKYSEYEKIYLKKELTLDEWKSTRKQKSELTKKAETRMKVDNLTLPRGLAASDNIGYTATEGVPFKIGELVDRNRIVETIQHFEKQIVNFDVENAIIITQSGEVFRCIGDKNNIGSILKLSDKLNGAYVTHNHPTGSANEYSFSNDDINLFMRFKLPLLRGIDEKFIYELNRNPLDLDIDNFNIDDLIGDTKGFVNRHIAVIKRARELGIGYRRWAR